MLSPEPADFVTAERPTKNAGKAEMLEGGDGAEAEARGNHTSRHRPLIPAWLLQRRQEEQDRSEDEALKARLLGLPIPLKPGSKAFARLLDHGFDTLRQRLADAAVEPDDDISF